MKSIEIELEVELKETEIEQRNLYRGKSIDLGLWVYGFYFFSEREQKHYIIGDSKDYGFQKIEIVPTTKGACACRTDKNDKVIFEGDILDLDNPYHPNQGFNTQIEILFCEAKNGMCYRYIDPEYVRSMGNVTTQTTFHLDNDYNLKTHSKIIGNIYDNEQGVK